MSRKVPNSSFLNEEERNTKRKDPPGFVPWSNPNEVLPTYTHRNPTQGPSTSGRQRIDSSVRRHHQDASAGAEAPFSRPGRHPPVFVEETRPGAILVPGIDDDGLTIEEGYDEQATIASNVARTVEVVARVVDTEEESRIRRQRDQACHEQDRIRHELDQARHERDQLQHERDHLRHILENAAVVTPIVTTSRDEENAGENIHADNQDGSPRSDDHKCGASNRGRRWCAIGAILVIAVAVTVTLALVLPSEPNPKTTPPPYPLDELLSSISNESLTGTIPTEIGMLSDNLTSIVLWYNGLTGTIPSEMGQLTKLTYLGLSGNNLSGLIPSQIGQLTKLTDLSLSNNTLSGIIPSEVGQLTKLTFLSLWNNLLTGPIPSEVGQLTKLTYLDLSDNTLTGTIPTEMNSLVNLYGLYLYGNDLTGTYTCPTYIEDCWISCEFMSDEHTDVCRSL